MRICNKHVWFVGNLACCMEWQCDWEYQICVAECLIEAEGGVDVQCVHTVSFGCVTCISKQGEKDWQKYETARNLKVRKLYLLINCWLCWDLLWVVEQKHVEKIRQKYREDWKSKMMHARQRSVSSITLAYYTVHTYRMKIQSTGCSCMWHDKRRL